MTDNHRQDNGDDSNELMTGVAWRYGVVGFSAFLRWTSAAKESLDAMQGKFIVDLLMYASSAVSLSVLVEQLIKTNPIHDFQPQQAETHLVKAPRLHSERVSPGISYLQCILLHVVRRRLSNE